jgi:transposase
MKQVARLIRNHFEGIVAWTQTRQSNGFLEALNGLFQAAKQQGTRLHPL